MQATIANRGEAPISGFEVAFYVGDPQRGGRLNVTQTVEASLTPGQTLEVEAELDQIPVNSEVKVYVVVDRQSVVPECSDDNNVRGSDALACFIP